MHLTQETWNRRGTAAIIKFIILHTLTHSYCYQAGNGGDTITEMRGGDSARSQG